MFNMLERLLCYNGYHVHMITHRCSWWARWSWKSWIFTIVNNSFFLVVSVRKYTKKYNYLAQYLFNDFFPHKMIIFTYVLNLYYVTLCITFVPNQNRSPSLARPTVFWTDCVFRTMVKVRLVKPFFVYPQSDKQGTWSPLTLETLFFFFLSKPDVLWGGRRVGARENGGLEGFGKWQRKGWEVGVLLGWEAGEVGRGNYATRLNIS